jgi:hypothetical protein
MIATGAKFYFGLAALALTGAVAYSWSTHGGLNGALTGGFSGGVGDHTGYVVFAAAALVAAFVGGLVVAFRDADPEAQKAVARVDDLPEVMSPKHASYWPVLGAAAAACTVVGLVASSLLFLFGVIVGIVVLLEWMVSSWSERATGDEDVNRRIRNRVMNPIEVPVFGAIGIFVLVLCVSRVLLAASESGAPVVAIGLALVILGAASTYAYAPKAGRTLVAVICVLAALGVIAGGIISAAQGSRTYEKHETDTISHTPDRRQPVPASAAVAN